MKNIVENQDIKTDKPLPMSYEALKAERDSLADRVNALAVENAEMREALDSIRIYSSDTLSGPSDSVPDMAAWLREGVEHLHQVSTIETPATDAALAAIRTESHIAGVEAAANRIGVISLKYNPGQKHELIKAIGREVIKYAADLREAK